MAAILMDLFRSLKMPLNAASLMIGIPVLVALGLYNLHARHLHVNVNWWYYPSFFLIYAVYVLPILFFALFVRLQPKPSPPSRPKTKFICFVPAYNEQDVIANPVCSLLRQDYPKDLYDIWVIFDGNDQTGERARALGVNVLETPTNGFGKQRALMWAFRRLLTENDERYACIFDADNVASENYLSAMNNAIQANGYRCLQSFHNVLNGPKNWITKALWCSCFSSSRLYLMGRMGVLRNALMCGTGW